MVEYMAKPQKVTEQWLKEMFAPLRMYLQLHYSSNQADSIIKYLMFMGSKDSHYFYRNKITRSIIVVNGQGMLISSAKGALNTLEVYRD